MTRRRKAHSRQRRRSGAKGDYVALKHNVRELRETTTQKFGREQPKGLSESIPKPTDGQEGEWVETTLKPDMTPIEAIEAWEQMSEPKKDQREE